ncbi:MAG TPA: hypothetical protein VFX33_16200 [Actinomycetales bacterium]|nr:hypothetical protein [Actinomycetales bacterium]
MDSYDLRHVEQRLAEDPRTAEMGVQLVSHSGRLFVRGQVSSDQRLRAVLEVIRELCPGADLVDEIVCTESELSQAPRKVEEIR